MGAAGGRSDAARDLWGDRNKGPEYAMLLKVPAGGDSGMHAHTADYHAVSVQGTWVHTVEGDPASVKDLGPGSYVFQPGKQMHQDQCKGKQECIIFVHQHGKGDFLPGKKPAADKAAAPAAPAPAAARLRPRQHRPLPRRSSDIRSPLPAKRGEG